MMIEYVSRIVVRGSPDGPVLLWGAALEGVLEGVEAIGTVDLDHVAAVSRPARLAYWDHGAWASYYLAWPGGPPPGGGCALLGREVVAARSCAIAALAALAELRPEPEEARELLREAWATRDGVTADDIYIAARAAGIDIPEEEAT